MPIRWAQPYLISLLVHRHVSFAVPDRFSYEASILSTPTWSLAMTPSSPTSTTLPETAILQSHFKAVNQLKGGASWFYWIAGLSLINSLILLAGSDWNFLIGLGLTQVFDAIAKILSAEMNSTAGLIIKAIAFLLDLGVAGLFVLFGWLAKKRYAWAFIVGMILYALDGLIFVLVGSWLSVGFHAFALFGLYGGLKAIYMLRRLPQLPPLAGQY